MNKKKIIVAGNWKMNKTYLEAKEFIAKLNKLPELKTKTIIATPNIYVDTLYINNERENVFIAMQNCSSFESGAYTGEISAKMIASLQLKYCIVGHSERRQYFGETDEIIANKLSLLIQNNVSPIFCIGETLEEREKNETFNVLRRQLMRGLKGIDAENMKKIVIAYEPVWAIGTGVTASKEQAEEVHQFICHLLSEIYTPELAKQIPILYGGSCNEKNAEDLFNQPNIWGGLIGGASLDIESFYSIMQIAEKINE
jgi:triosephosphate isomerase (TIM)